MHESMRLQNDIVRVVQCKVGTFMYVVDFRLNPFVQPLHKNVSMAYIIVCYLPQQMEHGKMQKMQKCKNAKKMPEMRMRIYASIKLNL